MFNLFAIALLMLDLFAIISLLSGRGMAGEKTIWITMILCLPIIGASIYYVLGRRMVNA